MSDAGFVDLHTHSRYSDGKLTPDELVEEALYKGLSAIALTDHDTMGGNAEAMAIGHARGLEVVPGIELSCEMEGLEVHILGLFVAPADPLLSRLEEIRQARETRMQAMLDKLHDMGIELTMNDIPQVTGRSFGRPHLAQALVNRGLVRSISEAFARYLGDSGPVYVEKERFTIPEAINQIRDCGGLSFVAHPGVARVFPHLPEILKLGIDGVEAYYPKHSPAITREIEEFCGRHDLLVCGGSDFHANGEGPTLGVPPISTEILATIRDRVGR